MFHLCSVLILTLVVGISLTCLISHCTLLGTHLTLWVHAGHRLGPTWRLHLLRHLGTHRTLGSRIGTKALLWRLVRSLEETDYDVKSIKKLTFTTFPRAKGDFERTMKWQNEGKRRRSRKYDYLVFFSNWHCIKKFLSTIVFHFI